MRILRLELRKTNICPYCIAAAAIFLCLLGLSFLFAYVPKLESGSQNSAVLFSSYSGIMAVNGAIALMAFSALSSAMGYRYVIREYCGAQAILLFSYPISPKRILTAKTLLLMMFTSIAASGGKKISITTGAANLHVVQLFYIMIDSFDDDCLKLTAVIKYQEKVQILSLVKCIPPRLM